MFNFQGSVACNLSFASFFILSHRFGFVKNFFQVFQNFFWFARFSVLFLQSVSLRQLCNSITSNSLCQVLFLIFSNFFLLDAASHASENRAQFPLSGGCQPSSVPRFPRQLHYLTTPLPLCQALFFPFFRFVNVSHFSSTDFPLSLSIHLDWPTCPTLSIYFYNNIHLSLFIILYKSVRHTR